MVCSWFQQTETLVIVLEPRYVFQLVTVTNEPCHCVFQLVTLANEKTSLFELWEERRILYEQCMDLQLFYRDTEQADTWMTKQEVRRQ